MVVCGCLKVEQSMLTQNAQRCRNSALLKMGHRRHRLLSDALAVAGIKVTLVGVIGGGPWVIYGSKETLRIVVDKVWEAVDNDSSGEIALDMVFEVLVLDKACDVIALEEVVGSIGL